MRVEVRLFAMQRAQTGRRSVSLELPDGADVAAAWAALVADLPVLAPSASSVRFARNGRYVEADAVLSEGDELAVIPPVAGGSGAGGAEADGGAADRADADGSGAGGAEADGGGAHSGAAPDADPDGPRHRRLELTETDIDDSTLAALRREVSTPADGAVVAFLGQTRETPGTPAPGQEVEAARFVGQRVEELAYEALEPMVLAVLREIANEIEARFGVRRLAIVHRLGEVSVGEVSVAIAVAAPHRDAAFAACRYAIEELKARAPIWKAERFASGRVWLGQPARSGPTGEPGPGG